MYIKTKRFGQQDHFRNGVIYILTEILVDLQIRNLFVMEYTITLSKSELYTILVYCYVATPKKKERAILQANW